MKSGKKANSRHRKCISLARFQVLCSRIASRPFHFCPSSAASLCVRALYASPTFASAFRVPYSASFRTFPAARRIAAAFHELIPINLHLNRTHRVGSSNFAPSPMSSRHGSQESLRHVNTLGSMSMLQVQSGSVRDSVSAAQKKKGIKSSLGRFFSKKEKVCTTNAAGDSLVSNMCR